MMTFSETVALVNDIIAEKPEGYKYTEDPKTAERRAQYSKDEASGTGCYYAHADGSPGCIVGTFIHKLNPDFDLKRIEFTSVARALFEARISTDNDSVQLLSDCQRAQDGGNTWREALDIAKRGNAASRGY